MQAVRVGVDVLAFWWMELDDGLLRTPKEVLYDTHLAPGGGSVEWDETAFALSSVDGDRDVLPVTLVVGIDS